MNLPNQLTIARLIMVPVFVVCMMLNSTTGYAAALVVFVVASATDYYDGKIARARKLVTNFGKLMDPVADKVLVISAFVMMINVPGLAVPAWAVIVIIARELLITGARSIAAGEGEVIGANWAGKTKAILQMMYIIVFLGLAVGVRLAEHATVSWVNEAGPLLVSTSYWAGVAVALFTLWSGVHFALLNWRNLKLGDL